MRATTSSLITAVCVLAVVGCGPSGPTAQEPSPTTTTDAVPTPTATQTPVSDVPVEVMLPATAWASIGPDDVREESADVVGWRVPEACDVGSPTGGLAMRTVTAGSGELETRVGVQQVVVLADADAAVAEADRLGDALTACTQHVPEDSTTYVVEPLAVGAQGVGLATDYYGGSVEGALDDTMGTYLGITRRGNAITLVAVDGGEGTVGTAREAVTVNAQAAWESLCTYDSAGC